MSSKLLDSKKRNQTEKTLRKLSKSKNAADVAHGPQEQAWDSASLKEQYGVIRQDILKLKDDLTRGFDMAKGMFEKKGFISELLKK